MSRSACGVSTGHSPATGPCCSGERFRCDRNGSVLERRRRRHPCGVVGEFQSECGTDYAWRAADRPRQWQRRGHCDISRDVRLARSERLGHSLNQPRLTPWRPGDRGGRGCGQATTHRMRIAIIRNSGSGKSTLARQLSAEHTLPSLDLDTIVWAPGKIGVLRERDAAAADAKAFCESNRRWVTEGCYGALTQHVLAYSPV